MDGSQPSDIEKRLSQLEHRVNVLESLIQEVRSSAKIEGPNVEKPPVLIVSQPSPAKRERLWERIDWEQFVGVRGALWLGAATLLIAVASVLLIRWQELSAVMQFLVAAALGIGLVAWGDRALQRKGRSPFGEAAGALGLGVLYADVLAAVRLGPVTVELALVLLAACVALGASMSARQRSQTLAVASAAGGYLAPWALGAVASTYGPVLVPAYLSALAIAFGWMAARRNWTLVWWSVLFGAWIAYAGCWSDASRYDWGGGRLAALALPSWTVLLGLLATAREQRRTLSGAEAWLLAITGAGFMLESYLLLVFARWSFWWLLASGAILLIAERWCRDVSDDVRTSILAALALIAAALAFAAGGVQGLMVIGWAALGYLSVWIGYRRSIRLLSIGGQVLWFWAVLYLLFVNITQGDVMWLIDVNGLAILSTAVAGAYLARRRLRSVTGTVASVYGAYAVWGAVWWWSHIMNLLAQRQRPVATEASLAVSGWVVYGDWMTTAGAALIGCMAILVGLRNTNAGARFGGGSVLIIALFQLLNSSQPFDNLWPFLSARGVMHLCVIAAFTFLFMVFRERGEGKDAGWSITTALTAWLAAAFAISIEIRQAVHLAVRDGAKSDHLASLITSLVWCLLAAVMLVKGIRSHYRWLRIGALGWICVTVLKVFGWDLAYLPDTMRLMSLFGLGLSLVGISWLYTRYVSGSR